MGTGGGGRGGGFSIGLVDVTQGVVPVHGLGDAILALPRALATHATPMDRGNSRQPTH